MLISSPVQNALSGLIRGIPALGPAQHVGPTIGPIAQPMPPRPIAPISGGFGGQDQPAQHVGPAQVPVPQMPWLSGGVNQPAQRAPLPFAPGGGGGLVPPHYLPFGPPPPGAAHGIDPAPHLFSIFHAQNGRFPTFAEYMAQRAPGLAALLAALNQ